MRFLCIHPTQSLYACAVHFFSITILKHLCVSTKGSTSASAQRQQSHLRFGTFLRAYAGLCKALLRFSYSWSMPFFRFLEQFFAKLLARATFRRPQPTTHVLSPSRLPRVRITASLAPTQTAHPSLVEGCTCTCRVLSSTPPISKMPWGGGGQAF